MAISYHVSGLDLQGVTTTEATTDRWVVPRSSAFEAMGKCNLYHKIVATVDGTAAHDNDYFEGEVNHTNTVQAIDYRHGAYTWDAHMDVLVPENMEAEGSYDDTASSTKVNHGSIYDTVDERTTFIARDVLNGTQDTTNITSRTSYDARHDHQIRSQPMHSDFRNGISEASPLELWVGQYERHESIAYRLEESPLPPYLKRMSKDSRGRRKLGKRWHRRH